VLGVHGISRRRIAVTSFGFALSWTVMSVFWTGLAQSRWTLAIVQSLVAFGVWAVIYLLRVRLTVYERGLEIRERGAVRQIELSQLHGVEVEANALLLKLDSGERVVPRASLDTQSD
jgi:hypothetical protein